MNTSRSFSIVAALLLALTCALRATPTENTRFRVLPAGKVTVDGQIDDWDLSGGIFVCDDVETQRESIAVWIHAMYDAHHLYLLARFIDETPLNNRGQTIASYGFSGDSLQFRAITAADTPESRASHWTCWKGSDGLDIMDLVYGVKFNEGKIRDAKTEGAQQAFSKNADGKGYVQEIAIPWKLLTKSGQAPEPGNGLSLTFEPNFSVGIAGRASLKDNFKANVAIDRVFTFMNFKMWGTASLEAKGKVEPQSLRLADAREFKVTLKNGVPQIDWTGLIQSKELPGFKTINFSMPEDGFISLNLKDKSGQVVRQLLNSAFYTKGEHAVKWDGLGNMNARIPGQPVEAGNYTWDALWHTGFGLKLRGWANNSGSTCWDAGPKSNWGGDHGHPTSAAADDKQVYLGWSGAEAGRALLACDFDGKVKWGNKRAGIAGVRAVAAEAGVVYVLGGSAGLHSSGGNIYKLKAADGTYLAWGETDVVDLAIKSLWPDDPQAPEKANAIAVRGHQLFLSFGEAGKVVVLDAVTGRLLKTLTVSHPGALFATAEDKLHVILEGATVVAIDVKTGDPRTAISGLTNATALTIDPQGLMYVGTRDPDNQVKVFGADGKLQRTIGRAGGRTLVGPWTPDGLRFIESICVAPDGKLWVAERDGFPRRVTSWDSKTGALVKEFFGGSTYGALGGAISPLDPDVMIGAGCEWRLDPETGRAKCVAVVTRDGMENARFGIASNGRLYLTVAPAWTRPSPFISIFERTGDGTYLLRARFYYENPNPKSKEPTTTRFWADANGDGQEQPEESVTVDRYVRFSAWYMRSTPDLTIYAEQSQLKVKGFTTCGAPLYDVKNPVAMPGDTGSGDLGDGITLGNASGFGSADGRVVLYQGRYGKERSTWTAYDIASGKLAWTYPDNFVGVHGSHKATPPEVGMIRGSYGVCGTATLPAPIGSIFAVATNVGEWHILTADGFYLTRLFQPDPFKQKWPETATPGANMTNAPSGMGGEDFGGSIAYGRDGKLYVQSGKTGFWNLEVTGLETVKAMKGGAVSLTPAETSQAVALRASQMQQAVGKRTIVVKKLTPAFTGKLPVDFKDAGDPIKFQKTEDSAVQVCAASDAQNLYLAWDVKDSTPWLNAAKTPEEMYVSGDTVDFQLATNASADPKRSEAGEGDLRLSIGNFSGTPTAVLYRRVSAQKKPKVFSSGVIKEYPMDFVDVVPNANIKVTKNKTGYVVEAAIPWTALTSNPIAGQTVAGDFGVTHGGPAGDRTRLRTYWSNQSTGLVDDAVFELKMEPKNWGTLDFAP